MGTLPALFLGHGNPMNALGENAWTRGWRDIGSAVPRPRAVLAISAHWFVPAVAVTAMERPRTIHDFGGFPKELFAFEYPAPGAPELAERVAALLAPLGVVRDRRWGLDHGTWSVLAHVYPDAGVPVVQLSIDETKPAAFHYDIGRRLAPLRDEDVLIVGSGNIVHNLHAFSWGAHPVDPFDWAQRFETRVREALVGGDDAALVAYESLGQDALLSVPTPDHYLPLLYVLGAHRPGEAVTFPVEGIDGGSISMLSVRLG
jgi:4,5-DOPA dioxygenase extradiol